MFITQARNPVFATLALFNIFRVFRFAFHRDPICTHNNVKKDFLPPTLITDLRPFCSLALSLQILLKLPYLAANFLYDSHQEMCSTDHVTRSGLLISSYLVHVWKKSTESLHFFNPQMPLLLSPIRLLPLRYSDCDITNKNSGSIKLFQV